MNDPEPDRLEPHLLVVDDDTRLAELLRRYLTDNGFRVTIAGDASVARAQLASFAFDLVVLDVMMPGENGLDLTRALRREGRVPILLLTAMGEPEDRVNGLEAGADDYLSKPFEPRELVLRIRNILQRRPEADPGPREIRLGGCRFDVVRGELASDLRRQPRVRIDRGGRGRGRGRRGRGGRRRRRRGLDRARLRGLLRAVKDVGNVLSGIRMPGGIEGLLEEHRLAGRSGRGQVDRIEAQPLERDRCIGALLESGCVARQH